MKMRTGFVSNSSSASFMVALTALTAKQYQTILDYDEFNHSPSSDSWDFELIDNDKFLRGYTYMDNGDLAIYLLNKVGVQVDKTTSPGILDSLMLTHYGFNIENDNY